MFNIRTRIFLLAIVALGAVATLFFIEQRDIQKQISISDGTLQLLDNVRSLSDLIHPIQKERGLSAGYLAGQNDKLYNLLLEQHEITESLWENPSNTDQFPEQKFSQEFLSRLKDMRDRVDIGEVDWQETREFYTTIVQRLMEQMILKVASLNYSQEISYKLQSLPYFSNSREHLGLIRAAINRGYQQGYLTTAELIEIGGYFRLFTDNLRLFEVISTEQLATEQTPVWLSNLHSEQFIALNSQIEMILGQKADLTSNSALQWWNDATQVVNEMKAIEDGLVEQIKTTAKKQSAYLKSYLFWYGLSTFLLLIFVGVLTALTVFRILQALSILINSLDRVERTQDFGYRIQSNAKDECGQLTFSINKLLSYTDKIIQEKDYLASTDLLTGAMNRRSFICKAEEEIKRSDRYGTALSLIFCDIDFFKSINDRFGHDLGDEVITKVMSIFKKTYTDS